MCNDIIQDGDMKKAYNVAVLNENKVDYIKVELLNPADGEVLVKVDACALCTLEQRIYSGMLKFDKPYAGGHEVAGHVVKTGDGVKHIKEGDHVALRLLTSCGECYYCRKGFENQCIDAFSTSVHKGIFGSGGLAEYMKVSAKSVYKVAEDLDSNHAALTEPLACCIHSINRANIELGDDVVVLGAGIMGAFHILLAKLRGARVIVCEVSDERIEAAEKIGADFLINTAKEDGIKKIKDLTDGRGADISFCTVPLSQVAQQSSSMLGKLGTTILYSSFHPEKPLTISPNQIHSSELMITGSVNPSTKDFLQAAKLLSAKMIDPSPFITHTFTFDRLEEGLAEALNPMSYRVIINI